MRAAHGGGVAQPFSHDDLPLAHADAHAYADPYADSDSDSDSDSDRYDAYPDAQRYDVVGVSEHV